VLDFDGTVLDTEEPVYRSWWELWDDHGHELARADWQALIGTDSGFDPRVELERRVGRPIEPDRLAHRLLRRDQIQAEHDVRDGIIAWLDAAATARIPVGIASSSPEDWVDQHLRRLGLRARFAAVVCAGEAVPPKPDPTSYRRACELLGAEPARSVAVEDSPPGVLAAVTAGLYTVAVPHPLTADLDLSAADVVTDSLAQLPLGEALRRAEARSAEGHPGAGLEGGEV
jgi:HAD superfamily hydrolase (TIGR01509 family)